MQIKCAWCGKTVPLTKNSRRPKQHLDSGRICVGSGQLIQTHNMLRTAMERNRKEKTPC